MNKYLKIARRRLGLARFERECPMSTFDGKRAPRYFISGTAEAGRWAMLNKSVADLANKLEREAAALAPRGTTLNQCVPPGCIPKKSCPKHAVPPQPQRYAEILPLRVEERCGGYAVVDGDGATIALAFVVHSIGGRPLDPDHRANRDEKRAKRTAQEIAIALGLVGAS